MALTMRWVGEGDLDRVIQTRMRCYAAAPDLLAKYQQSLFCAGRAWPGDFLLAERDGRDVGTTTSLSLTMWMRGTAFSCQGVAYVGAIKTERRKGRHVEKERRSDADDRSPGVATAVMRETVREARERGHVLTALMPFRASFYEHFGYGLTERRCDWTVPLAIMPAGDFDGMRFMDESDKPAIADCSQRMIEHGQCQIEWPAARWESFHAMEGQTGWMIVDRPDDSGPVRGWMRLKNESANGREIVRVDHQAYDSPTALLRQLRFLGSLRDQYWGGSLTLPSDLPLTRLLKESQIAHRPVSHSVADVRTYTRMQIRVLDHKSLLEGLQLPQSLCGSLVVHVAESEGELSRLKLDIADGRIVVTATDSSPDLTCTDRVWASLVSGETSASNAWRWGLIEASGEKALRLLDGLCDGPSPFCSDFF